MSHLQAGDKVSAPLGTPDVSMATAKFCREPTEDVHDVSPAEDNVKAGCWKRMFPNGLLPHGGMLASGFNLASATLGAGSLSLPSAMSQGGGLFGTIFLVLCCASTVYSIRLLIITLELTGYTTYEEMAHKLIGPKFEKLTAFLIVMFCWGISVVYVVAMGDILDPIRNTSGFPEVFKGDWGRRLLITMFWCLFMLPLSLAREINTLRYASLAGMAATVFLVIAITVHAVQDEAPISNIPIMKFEVSTIMALPIIIFSYCCQTNSFEIYAELKDRSVNKMTLTTLISMGACTCIYIVCGLAGVADFGSDVDGNILNNYPNPTKTAYLAVAFVGVSITLTMAFPICIFPTRDAVLQMLGYKSAYKTPPHVRVPVAGMLAVSAVIAGLFVPGVSVMFGLLGGICGSTLAFMWPGFFILKTGKWNRAHGVSYLSLFCTYALIIGGGIGGILGTAVSIYQQF